MCEGLAHMAVVGLVVLLLLLHSTLIHLLTFPNNDMTSNRVVLVTVMRKHQRYFAVRESGGLLPFFITVANGPIDSALVRAGNEAVLRARFEDARFFYNSDRKKTLLEHRWVNLSSFWLHLRGLMVNVSDTGRMLSFLDHSTIVMTAAKRSAPCSSKRNWERCWIRTTVFRIWFHNLATHWA